MNKKKYRKVNGILLLDKPINISSNHALQKARRLFAAEKAGHGGSLDVLASGLLPVFFGEATKFSQFLLNAKKHYLTVAELGIKTSTGDAEGEIISQRPVVDITEEKILNVIQEFLGETQQIPSMYSALKFQGKPLYELARKGIEVERAARSIVVDQLQLLQINGNEITLNVHCSKGTYIRNLVEDIGEKLGCGAYVKLLRRLGAGDFTEKQMVTFAMLEEYSEPVELDKYLLPMDYVLQAYPAVNLNEEQTKKLQQGQAIEDFSWTISPANLYRVYNHQGQFIGLSEIREDSRLYAKRLLAT